MRKQLLPGLMPINAWLKYKLLKQQLEVLGDCGDPRPSPPNTQQLWADKSLIAAGGREKPFPLAAELLILGGTNPSEYSGYLIIF